MSDKTGTIYGIGVGPGDPDLLTIKALKILRKIPNILAACSTKNDYSLAGDIVQKRLPHTEIERLPFPMTRDPEILENAWKKNAMRLIDIVKNGEDAAFITIGDPMTYSTFSYVLRTIRQIAPEQKIIIVPGVTSYSAAAAACEAPLAEGEESLHVISGAKGGESLKRIFHNSDNVVILKSYKNLDDIKEALDELGLSKKAIFASRCGLDGEIVVDNVNSFTDDKASYLSLIIVKNKSEFIEKSECRIIDLPDSLSIILEAGGY